MWPEIRPVSLSGKVPRQIRKPLINGNNFQARVAELLFIRRHPGNECLDNHIPCNDHVRLDLNEGDLLLGVQ